MSSKKNIIIKAQLPFFNIDLKELFHYRWVFFMLVLRDIKLRYKQTALGIGWVVLQPLLTALLFTVVFGLVIRLPSDGVPYVVFAFCGLIPWLVFSQSLQRATTSLIGESSLITKVYFPRIFIPLASTFGVIIDYLICLSIAGILIGIYRLPFTWNLLFLPVCTIILFVFSTGINLFFSSVSVYYRDFKHIVPFLVQLWMYASPLLYSANMIPERYRFIYSLNPIAGIIDSFRWALLGLDTFPTYSFNISVIISFMLIILGTIVFRKIEHFFADII